MQIALSLIDTKLAKEKRKVGNRLIATVDLSPTRVELTSGQKLLTRGEEPSFRSSGTDDESESWADPGHRHSHAIRSDDGLELTVFVPECQVEIGRVSNDHAVVAYPNQIGEQTTWVIECCPVSLRVDESVLRQLATAGPDKIAADDHAVIVDACREGR